MTAPPARLFVVVAALVALVACAGGSGRGAELPPEGEATPPPPEEGAPEDDSECAPDRVGLSGARVVPLWSPPEGCTRANAVGQTDTVRSEEELRARYTCPPGVAFGIDFSRDQLVLADRVLSPAQAGSDVYDDGARITFVNRQRANCPDDPRPMPTPYTLAFLLPTGAERTHAEVSCTVRRACR
ncbi:MAG: hypothetical protein Q8P18_19830 [Pseudomonadota bacterium]|nr:hypothetical protein [Pseudomonadota bacterium]